MDSDSTSERLKRIEDMDLVSQLKEIIEKLRENNKSLEELKEKIEALTCEIKSTNKL